MAFKIHPKYSKKLIAKDPIPCFKPCLPPKYLREPWIAQYEEEGKVWYSPFMEFRYREGHTFQTDIWEHDLMLNIFDGEIRYGFHSFETSIAAFQSRDWPDHDHCVVEFEIPAGAEYYINPSDGKYISNKIKCVGYYPLYRGIIDSFMYPFFKTFQFTKLLLT